MAGLLSKKAKFEDVVLDKDILEIHYERYSKGDRDLLARQCFTYVEQAIQENKRWAIELRRNVYKND